MPTCLNNCCGEMASPQGDVNKKPPKVPPKPPKLYRSHTVGATLLMPEKPTARFSAGHKRHSRDTGPSEAVDAPISQVWLFYFIAGE